MSNSSQHSPGGFLHPTLPSPAPTSTTSSPSSSHLPSPRTKPLRPGSSKEEAARRFVETRLLHISRRYTKKFQPLVEGAGMEGYSSMRDVCRDLGEVVDVLWISGTPSLQVPYLLNVALAISTYLSAFPPAPTSTFALLRKMDYAFASLLKGADIDSGIGLPGFEGTRGGMSRTDMVRCRSLVEGTRVEVTKVMSQEIDMTEASQSGLETGDEVEDEEMDIETEGGKRWGSDDDDDDDDRNMDVARVYERTIVALGEALDRGTAYDASI